MAFRLPKEVPDFARLRTQLIQAGFQQKNPAAYQAIDTLIRFIQQMIKDEEDALANLVPDLSGLVAILTMLIQADYLTWTDEATDLPNSRQLLAGTGITFNDSVANERTISSSGAGQCFVPMVTGAEPLEIMSNGAGDLLLIAYEP